MINLLDETTINQIAAGEVVERPFNVVKELIENALDSGATAITVEIKDGGSKLIRITDNGEGIAKEEVRKAFLRHATSKISCADDLNYITSLGFRGEALSSICAVSNIEMISRKEEVLTGFRYLIEGSREISLEEIGAPKGTTVIVRDLFFNTPARKKFLKSNLSEAGMISGLMEHIALSNPSVGFKYIVNGRNVFSTSGNGNIEEIIYRIYGKEIMDSLLPIEFEASYVSITGYIAKSEINRGSRTYENFFVNGRFVSSEELSLAVEEGFRGFLMQHKFPFCVLYLEVDPKTVDVNVHPAKMQIRLANQSIIAEALACEVRNALGRASLIPEAVLMPEEESIEPAKSAPEPFEINRRASADYVYIPESKKPLSIKREASDEEAEDSAAMEALAAYKVSFDKTEGIQSAEQLNVFSEPFLSPKARPRYRLLGQLFKTYWLFEYDEKLYILDQHAAHEKVKFERLFAHNRDKEVFSQPIVPPLVFDLSLKEAAFVKEYSEAFSHLGFEIEDFGSGSIKISAFPVDLYGCDERTFFREILDDLIKNPLKGSFDVVLNRLASMACKAAVKGNTTMSEQEVCALMDELMTLDNPYNCPHGRPTIISMSKYEIEKKFKRITD